MTWNRVSNYKTVIFEEQGYTTVIYHTTKIVQFNQDQIILNSGGYRTTTTKRKMNQVSYQFNLGYSVYQEDFNWYIDYRGMTIPFVDNIVLIRGITPYYFVLRGE